MGVITDHGKGGNMREVIITRPKAEVVESLRGSLGQEWNITILADDDMGITFRIKKDDIKKHGVEKQLTQWAKTGLIRAGIVATFQVTNPELTRKLDEIYRLQSVPESRGDNET